MSDKFPPRTAEDRDRARQERERRRAEKSRAEAEEKASGGSGHAHRKRITAGQPAIQRPGLTPLPSRPASTSRTASGPPDKAADPARAARVHASWQAARRADAPDSAALDRASQQPSGRQPTPPRAAAGATPQPPGRGAAGDESGLDRDEVQRCARELIEAYQETLGEVKARKLEDEATALVKHVLAESCDKAAAEAARLGRPATARDLRTFRATFSDPLGWVLRRARDQAADQVRETAADLPAKIAELKVALVVSTGWVVAAASGLMAFGGAFAAALVQHPGPIRIIAAVAVAGGGAGGVWLEKQLADARQDFKDALAVAEPIAPLLAHTLDRREASYFAAVGSPAPSRHSLALAGPTYVGLLGVCAAIAVVCALLILVGAGIAFASFIIELSEQASQPSPYIQPSPYTP